MFLSPSLAGGVCYLTPLYDHSESLYETSVNGEKISSKTELTQVWCKSALSVLFPSGVKKKAYRFRDDVACYRDPASGSGPALCSSSKTPSNLNPASLSTTRWHTWCVCVFLRDCVICARVCLLVLGQGAVGAFFGPISVPLSHGSHITKSTGAVEARWVQGPRGGGARVEGK